MLAQAADRPTCCVVAVPVCLAVYAGALQELSEPSLIRVGSGLGAAGRSLQLGNNEKLARISMPALGICSSDIWVRSGATGELPLALQLPSFASSANPGADFCVQANGGEVGTCFEPPPPPVGHSPYLASTALASAPRKLDENRGTHYDHV